MRTIKFRGKRVDNGEWVYGDVMHIFPYKVKIIPHDFNCPENFARQTTHLVVHPESVGQFTGLLTKSRKEIFDKDIVGGHPHGTVEVRWNDEFATYSGYWSEKHIDEETGEAVIVEREQMFSNELKDCFNEWEVIGNSFDNPELLKP